MRRTHTTQRLALHRTTLRALAGADLDRARGGMIYSVLITLACPRPPREPDDATERGGSTADGEPPPGSGAHCYRGG